LHYFIHFFFKTQILHVRENMLLLVWAIIFWAISLNMMLSSSIHFLANNIIHSSLWLSSTPLCK
jgi:hypothetical protein